MTRPPKAGDGDGSGAAAGETQKKAQRRAARAAAAEAAKFAAAEPAQALPVVEESGLTHPRRSRNVEVPEGAGPVPAGLIPAGVAPVKDPGPALSGSQPTETDPVFILAAPRSFSSLVNAMIGQHPQLYGVPELNLFQCETVAEFNSGLSANGQKKSPFWKTMRHGLLRTIAQVYSGEQTDESIRMAERWLKLRTAFTAAEVFHELADAVAPLRIVEKSPGVLRHKSFMDRMLEAFPKARFIHLVRHPIPQGESVLKTKGGVGVLLALNSVDMRGIKAHLEPQMAWHDAQIQILRFLDGVPDDQFITLRGEDLMNDLDGVLPALCRWLGISDAPEAIEAMKHPENSPYSCMGPSTASLGNDVNFLKSPRLRPGKITVPALDSPLPWRDDKQMLHPRVQALAKALGY